MNTMTRAIGLAAATGMLGAITLAQEAAGDADQKSMQGEWTVVTAVRNGKKRSDEQIAKMKIIFKGDGVTVAVDGRGEEAKFTLDPAKKPKVIDIKPKDGTFAGIYDLAGDSLKIAWTRDEKNRPTEFKEEGAGVFLLVLKRAK